MSSVFGPLRLIVNPRAGRGVVGRTLPELEAELRARSLDYDVVQTRRAGHATEAARSALDEGLRYLIAVGGDGTVHEVVNGMFQDGKAVAPEAVLGVAAAGSGCDFVRTFGLDRKPKFLGPHFASDTWMDIDVGLATFVRPDGTPGSRLFANIAEVGYGAEVVRRAARLPRFIGRLRYLLGAYGAIRGHHRQTAPVTVGHTTATVPVVNLVVANAQFFGGGMNVAPRALPDDGQFNVQIYNGDRSQVFLLTRKMFRGDHLPDPKIIEYQSPTVSFAPPDPMPVEADGEVLGTTPATFSVLHQVLRLKI